MVKHIVFWTFKDHADGREKAENLERMVAGLRTLPSEIKQIKEFEVGVNSVAGPANWEVSLYSAFANWEDFEAYKIHPKHQEVVALAGLVVLDRAVCDYEV